MPPRVLASGPKPCGGNNSRNHLQTRIYLWQQNTALLLKTECNLTRKSQLLAEKEKLTSTNKIHNFTDINFPLDLIELLNKGSNFIPTTDNINTPKIKKTIFSETTPPSPKLSTKEPAHTKPRTNLSERKLQTLTIDTILTPKRIRSSYFKKNKPNLILIYILSIMFITLLVTPNNTYNLQTSKTFSIHNTSTSLSRSHPTSTI